MPSLLPKCFSEWASYTELSAYLNISPVLKICEVLLKYLGCHRHSEDPYLENKRVKEMWGREGRWFLQLYSTSFAHGMSHTNRSHIDLSPMHLTSSTPLLPGFSERLHWTCWEVEMSGINKHARGLRTLPSLVFRHSSVLEFLIMKNIWTIPPASLFDVRVWLGHWRLFWWLWVVYREMPTWKNQDISAEYSLTLVAAEHEKLKIKVVTCSWVINWKINKLQQ